jgi:DNA/RNA-binding domain of Phe-tRNA-synthetase-like protein
MMSDSTYFQVTPEWQAAFPGASMGVLVMTGLANPESHSELDARKDALEFDLRVRYAAGGRAGITALPVIQAYDRYYAHFKKTYHVQLQLESVALKGKSLPHVAALVEAMFMAELKNQLLTAGHDLDTLQLPAVLSVSTGAETYTLLRGVEQALKPDDMFIADRAGVISSIIYGPDQRTPIRPTTTAAMFTVYAPAGVPVAAVEAHLNDIAANARLVSPTAVVSFQHVFISS